MSGLTREVPEDVLRIAADHSGRLADIVRLTGNLARADHIDIVAEHFQKEAAGEQVDWTAVLTEHAARELKLQGPETGA